MSKSSIRPLLDKIEKPIAIFLKDQGFFKKGRTFNREKPNAYISEEQVKIVQAKEWLTLKEAGKLLLYLVDFIS